MLPIEQQPKGTNQPQREQQDINRIYTRNSQVHKPRKKSQLHPPNPHTNHHTKSNPQSEVRSQNPDNWYTGVMSPITGTEVQSQGP